MLQKTLMTKPYVGFYLQFYLEFLIEFIENKWQSSENLQHSSIMLKRFWDFRNGYFFTEYLKRKI